MKAKRNRLEEGDYGFVTNFDVEGYMDIGEIGFYDDDERDDAGVWCAVVYPGPTLNYDQGYYLIPHDELTRTEPELEVRHAVPVSKIVVVRR